VKSTARRANTQQDPADTGRFVFEMWLLDPPAAVERVLLARLETARFAYNQFLSELLRRDALMRESVTYRRLLGENRLRKQRETKRRKLGPNGRFSDNPVVVSFASAKERNEAWMTLRRQYGLDGSYCLAKYVPTVAAMLKPRTGDNRLHVTMLHELASRAWTAFEGYLFGKSSGPGRRGKPRRRPSRLPLTTITTRSSEKNRGPIQFLDDRVEWRDGRGQKHRPLTLRAMVDWSDDVTRYALAKSEDGTPVHAITQVRLGYRLIRGKRRWFAQLVLAGSPYRKPRELASGSVGIDVGAKHIAVVAPDIEYHEIIEPNANVARSLCVQHASERRRARAQDRSRRATNPEAFDDKGRYREGKKVTVRSKRYHVLSAERREIARHTTETKRQQTNALANRLIVLGQEVKMENLSYCTWQAGGMGRSLAVSTPGALSAALQRAAAKYHRDIVLIDARAAKLSQRCHACGAFSKDAIRGAIASRMSTCSCGRPPVQRDLYSAFLASFCDAQGTFDATQAKAAWARMSKSLAVAAPNEIKPTSTGPSASSPIESSGCDGSEMVAIETQPHPDAGLREVGAEERFTVSEAAGDHRDHDVERFGGEMTTHRRSKPKIRGETPR
jgi:putative transposase